MPARIVLDLKDIKKWRVGTKEQTKLVELNSEDISLLINFTEENFKLTTDQFMRELEEEDLKEILETLDISGIRVVNENLEVQG